MNRGAKPPTDPSELDADLRRLFEAMLCAQTPEHLLELERTLLELLRQRAGRQ